MISSSKQLRVKQTVGDSTKDVMSQRAVKEAIIIPSISLVETIPGTPADATSIKFLNDTKLQINKTNSYGYGLSDFEKSVVSVLNRIGFRFTGCDFSDSYFAPGEFDEGGLTGADLTNVKLNGCFFNMCNLTDTILVGAEVNGTAFDLCIGLGDFPEDSGVIAPIGGSVNWNGIIYFYADRWVQWDQVGGYEFTVDGVWYVIGQQGELYTASEVSYNQVINEIPEYDVFNYLMSMRIHGAIFTDVHDLDGNPIEVVGDGAVGGVSFSSYYIGTDGNRYNCWYV